MIREVHLWNSSICFVMGLTLNTLLIWLVIYRSPTEMHLYSRILLQTCFIDLALCVLTELAQPILFIHHGAMLFYSNNEFINGIPSPFWRFMIQDAWMFIFYFSIYGLSVQFAYRYLVLVRNTTVSLTGYFLMLAAPVGITMINCIMLFLTSAPWHSDQYSIRDTMISELLYTVPIEPIQCSVHTVLADPLFIGTTLLGVLSNLLFYLTIAICGHRMIRFVQREMQVQSAENKRTLDLHKQLTRNLIILVIVPLGLMLINMGICVSLLLPYDSSESSLITTVHMLSLVPHHWLPVLNPLATMLTIRAYRNTIRDRIWCRGHTNPHQ